MRSFFLKVFSTVRTRKATREEGQTLVEYTLIIAIITIVLLASFSFLGRQVISIFSAITTLLDTAQAS